MGVRGFGEGRSSSSGGGVSRREEDIVRGGGGEVVPTAGGGGRDGRGNGSTVAAGLKHILHTCTTLINFTLTLLQFLLISYFICLCTLYSYI